VPGGSNRVRLSPAKKRLRADLLLLTAATVWGSNFTGQRVAASYVGFFLYNGTRFLLGALTLTPIVRNRWRGVTPLEIRGGVLAGFLLFVASSLQQAGLAYTTAGKAGFVTGLYVIIVPLFLALGWRQWPRCSVWVASLLAATGLFLLNAEARFVLSFGDGLELGGAVLWAAHVILIGRLASRVDTLRLAMVQYLVCGLLNTVLGLLVESDTLCRLPVVWWAVAYGGIASVGLGYTLQVLGQEDAPATDAAIVLSMEAVFAALFGWLLLGETLTPKQMLGGGLMLTGMLLAQVSGSRPQQPSASVRKL